MDKIFFFCESKFIRLLLSVLCQSHGQLLHNYSTDGDNLVHQSAMTEQMPAVLVLFIVRRVSLRFTFNELAIEI